MESLQFDWSLKGELRNRDKKIDVDGCNKVQKTGGSYLTAPCQSVSALATGQLPAGLAEGTSPPVSGSPEF